MNNIYQSFNIQKEINEKFDSLMKSGKMSLTITLEESTKRGNVDITEPHDEDILQAKRDEYYINKTYKCNKCKEIKSRQEFFHLAKNGEGISHKCKTCEMKYLNDSKQKG